MSGIREVLGRFFRPGGVDSRTDTTTKTLPPEKPVTALRGQHPLYKKGDFIGHKYEVHDVVGTGGFGVVYLVYCHETKSVYALKTFRDELIADEQTKGLFRREASVWVQLDRHPYLVRAYWVDEVDRRPYIAMEYVAPNEQGLNSLQGYLTHTSPDLVQTLRWSIQFSHGMIYAHSKGVRCHRDIKPANILITQDKTAKISDFGLVAVFSSSSSGQGVSLHSGGTRLSGHTAEGLGFGTPTHMSPEQFTNAAACDQRSDIYSFGVVLYEMATGGKLPFLAPPPSSGSDHEEMRFWRAMYRLHKESPIPKVNSPLFPIVRRCLQKEPTKRYQSFENLLNDLEVLFKHEADEVITPPAPQELDSWEWNNKGMSLRALGLHDEAMKSFDRSLQLNRLDPFAWNNKGQVLCDKGRYEEALNCLQQAVRLNPLYVAPYNNMGLALSRMGNLPEALRCYEHALQVAPDIPGIWINKGDTLRQVGRLEDALFCYKRATTLNLKYLAGWIQMGNCLMSLGETFKSSERLYEAISCYDEALAFEEKHWEAWRNRAGAFVSLKEYEKALDSVTRAIMLRPQDSMAWYLKAVSEDYLEMEEHARNSYLKFLSLEDGRQPGLADVVRRRLG